MARPKSRGTAYTLKINLDGIKPRIWRTFSVPGEITLDRLHDVIQIVMGWQESHLHCFQIDGERYTEASEDQEMDGLEEGGAKLCDLVLRAKIRFEYEYDFGDGWHHTLVVDHIQQVPEKHRACVACFEGKRRCPPEDVGGVSGYEEFVEAIRDSKHEEHDRYLEWVGGKFDSEHFDIRAVNLELLKYARWARPRVHQQELLVGGLSDP